MGLRKNGGKKKTIFKTSLTAPVNPRTFVKRFGDLVHLWGVRQGNAKILEGRGWFLQMKRKS